MTELDGAHPAQTKTPLAVDLLKARIRKHEGLRLSVYDDATGKPIVRGSLVQGVPTIGFGRNLKRGLTENEAHYLLSNDVDTVISEVRRALPWVKDLDHPRWSVIMEMAYNTGTPRLLEFKRTLASVKAGDYETAAVQMLQSKWADQVGKRALTLAEIMRTGEWQ